MIHYSVCPLLMLMHEGDGHGNLSSGGFVMKKLLYTLPFFLVSSTAFAGATFWIGGGDELMTWWDQLTHYLGLS